MCVGELVITPEDIWVTIDCGQLIDEVASTTNVTNPTVTWYKDGAVLITGSAINVEISDESRLCIITDTLLAVGGQLGTDGNYSCEVCSTPTNCQRNDTCAAVCGESDMLLISYSFIDVYYCLGEPHCGTSRWSSIRK